MITNSSNKTFGIFFSIIFLIFFVWSYIYSQFNFILLILSISFFFISFTLPILFLPLNLLWENLGKILHFVFSSMILFLTYFIVFLFTGFLLKIFSFDPFGLKEINNKSLWKIRKTKPNSLKNLF